eukprot:5992710-Ditylum_brightwellii.AAC.1
MTMKKKKNTQENGNDNKDGVPNESILAATKMDKIILGNEVVGSTQLSDGSSVSVGYYTPSSSSAATTVAKKTIWSIPGTTEGLVPITFTTNAPYMDVAMLRGMGCGPLLAFVCTTAPIISSFTKEEEDCNTTTNTSPKHKKQKMNNDDNDDSNNKASASSSSSKTLHLSYNQSLEEASKSIIQYFHHL